MNGLSMPTGTQDAILVIPPTKKSRLNYPETSETETQETGQNNTMQSASGQPPQQSRGGVTNGQGAVVANGENAGTGKGHYDTNFYSRQHYALGESAMKKLREANVLISGMGAVGVEIAKNLSASSQILGGVRNVTIHDTKNATWLDLSAQFYLSGESSIGKNRAEECFAKLEELNDTVKCALQTQPLTEDFVKDFDLVVLTDASFETQLQVNDWMRQHGKQFISSDARGLFSYIFVDLGMQFPVEDHNGEACKEVLIEHVNGETGDVFTLEETRHDFEDGDYVSFSEVKGMVELNSLEKPLKVTITKPNVFNIGTAAKEFSTYAEGGRARQEKVVRYLDFKPLRDSMESPDFLIWDFAHFDYPPMLHALWQALYKFESMHKRSPKPRCVEDAELLKQLLPTGAPEISDELLRSFSFQAIGNLQPVASAVGGICAQEAMKAVTHHTMPLRQFLYMEFLDALPGDYSPLCVDKLKVEDFQPRNTRYDGQAAVFGWPFQEALAKQRWFVVGAGAIGCELLKNMAMIGLGCAPGGCIRITDMDTIELSNLNRQFLFRRHDVGKKKADIASKAVKSFNAEMNIESLAERVAEDTEAVFNDSFFDGLDGVANALDNVNARRYVDRRCVYYELPLLESGTMGGKGNTQVVFPHLTESYSSSNDPPEKETPVCTLKNFPYEIQHTIQWAREKFADLFTLPAETANQYIEDVRGFLERLKQMSTSQQIDLLTTVKRALVDERPASPEDCVAWARGLFEQYYSNDIRQLVHTLPATHKTEQGVKFWSGTKRYPHPLTFDPTEETHRDFVVAASILHAIQYNLKPITDEATVVELARAYKPVVFEPRTGVKIAVTDAEAKQQQDDDGMSEDSDLVINKLNVSLARLQVSGLQPLTAIDFEKDDDDNHHVQFIAAASNLRANNYDIQPADRMKTKQIAGNIIPALATTTSAIAGLAMVELFKMVGAWPSGSRQAGKRAPIPIGRFKNGFVNLALPFFAFSEPIAAPVKKYGDVDFTLWDRLEIRAPMTLQQVIETIRDKTGGLDVTMMSAGVSLLYAFFMPEKKKQERLATDVIKAIEEVSRGNFPAHRRAAVLDVVTSTDADEDVEIPFIKYTI